MTTKPASAPFLIFGFLLMSIGLLVVSPEALSQDEEAYRVIVNPSNPITSLTRADLSDLFLKRQKNWTHDGSEVEPIDLKHNSGVRVRFTAEVHGKAVPAVRAYWQRLIFQGREVPPPTRNSEQEVFDYVRAKPNAIGYVSSHAAVPQGVKVLSIVE